MSLIYNAIILSLKLLSIVEHIGLMAYMLHTMESSLSCGLPLAGSFPDSKQRNFFLIWRSISSYFAMPEFSITNWWIHSPALHCYCDQWAPRKLRYSVKFLVRVAFENTVGVVQNSADINAK